MLASQQDNHHLRRVEIRKLKDFIQLFSINFIFYPVRV